MASGGFDDHSHFGNGQKSFQARQRGSNHCNNNNRGKALHKGNTNRGRNTFRGKGINRGNSRNGNNKDRSHIHGNREHYKQNEDLVNTNNISDFDERERYYESYEIPNHNSSDSEWSEVSSEEISSERIGNILSMLQKKNNRGTDDNLEKKSSRDFVQSHFKNGNNKELRSRTSYNHNLPKCSNCNSRTTREFEKEDCALLGNVANGRNGFKSWTEPRPLIQIVKGRIKINEETEKLLEDISLPAVVVGIAGSYREGKSFLMNRIARSSQGFSVSRKTETHTKGIWVWVLAHPTRANTALVLLDTEGLDNPKENNKNQDMMIMSLTVLLSSTLIYNIKGKADANMIEKLTFVTELLNKIKVNELDIPKSTYSNYMLHFPTFLLAVRDFDLELDGSPDDYLEEILKFRSYEHSESTYNKPRKIIRTAFKNYHCFVFPRPVNDNRHMKFLHNLEDEQLAQDFLKEVKKLNYFIYNKSSIKKIAEETEVSIKSLMYLTKSFAKSLNEKNHCYIETVLSTFQKEQNQKVIEISFEKYKKEMDKIRYPALEEVILRFQERSSHLAMKYLIDNALPTDLEREKKVLQEKITEAYTKIVQENIEASSKRCLRILNAAYHEKIGKKMKEQYFCGPRCYNNYKKLMTAVMEDYEKRAQNEIQFLEVKERFLGEKRRDAIAIMTIDRKLTETQKKKEEQLKAKEQEEIKWRMQQEEIKSQKLKDDAAKKLEKQLAEDHKKRSKDLASKCKPDMETLLKKCNEERKKLEKEGFFKEAKEMGEISQVYETKWNKYLIAGAAGVICFAATAAALFAPSVLPTAVAHLPAILQGGLQLYSAYSKLKGSFN